MLLEAQKVAANGNLNEALRLLRKGLSIAKKTRDKRDQSLIHPEMGLCYQEKGHPLSDFPFLTIFPEPQAKSGNRGHTSTAQQFGKTVKI
jgi:hypothetical protein